jgi:hypothetical protein
MNRALFAAVALMAGLSAASLLSESAGGDSLLLPPAVTLNGRTNRLGLPGTAPKPITLILEGKIAEPNAAEGRPPPLATLSLQFDKAGAIFTKGLPICRPHRGSPDWEWTGCEQARVGHGEVEIETRVPGFPAFHSRNEMQIYNGAPQDGRPVFIYKVLAHMPPPTTFVTAGVVEPSQGKYGTQTTIAIPKLADGYGSLIGFRAEIGRSWTFHGREYSLLMANCPRGSLSATDAFDFPNGYKSRGGIVRRCGPKRPTRPRATEMMAVARTR